MSISIASVLQQISSNVLEKAPADACKIHRIEGVRQHATFLSPPPVSRGTWHSAKHQPKGSIHPPLFKSTPAVEQVRSRYRREPGDRRKHPAFPAHGKHCRQALGPTENLYRVHPLLQLIIVYIYQIFIYIYYICLSRCKQGLMCFPGPAS